MLFHTHFPHIKDIYFTVCETAKIFQKIKSKKKLLCTHIDGNYFSTAHKNWY